VEQEVFIGRVKSALGHPTDAAGRGQALFNARDPSRFAALIGNVRDRKDADFDLLYNRLVEAAEPLKLNVIQQADAEAVADSIQDLVRDKAPEWGKIKSLVAWEHPLITALKLERLFSDQKVPVNRPKIRSLSVKDRQTFRDQVREAYIGVTSADYCMADTATLVLRTRAGQARSVSLVPSIHIAVIKKRQIIADMQELFALLQGDPSEYGEGLTNCMTFISGPSKTADIEATLVHGAHGPKEMYLYVIDE